MCPTVQQPSGNVCHKTKALWQCVSQSAAFWQSVPEINSFVSMCPKIRQLPCNLVLTCKLFRFSGSLVAVCARVVAQCTSQDNYATRFCNVSANTARKQCASRFWYISLAQNATRLPLNPLFKHLICMSNFIIRLPEVCEKLLASLWHSWQNSVPESI